MLPAPVGLALPIRFCISAAASAGMPGGLSPAVPAAGPPPSFVQANAAMATTTMIATTATAGETFSFNSTSFPVDMDDCHIFKRQIFKRQIFKRQIYIRQIAEC